MFASFHVSQYQLVDFGAPVSFHIVFRPLVNQFRPFSVILRRIRPAGETDCCSLFERPMMLIRFRMGGQRLRHETDFHIRPDSLLAIGVKNPIQNRPVVNWVSLRILGIGAGRTPLERRRAVAAGQQIMRAEINLIGRQCAKFAEQFLSVRPGGVVRFVRAEVSPGRTPMTLRFVHVDLDGDGKCCVCGKRTIAAKANSRCGQNRKCARDHNSRPLQNWSAGLRPGANVLIFRTRRVGDRRSVAQRTGFYRGLDSNTSATFPFNELLRLVLMP